MLTERDGELGHVQYNKIQKARYNKRYKYIRTVGRVEYLKKEGNGGNQRLIARARCGNIEEGNRYWLDEERRKCTLCSLGIGIIKYLLKDCQRLETSELREEEIAEGRRNEAVIS